MSGGRDRAIVVCDTTRRPANAGRGSTDATRGAAVTWDEGTAREALVSVMAVCIVLWLLPLDRETNFGRAVELQKIHLSRV